MIKEQNKKNDIYHPSKDKGQMDQNEFRRRFEEIIRSRIKRVSFKKKIYSKIIAELFIQTHPFNLTIKGIYTFINKGNPRIIIEKRNFRNIKIGDYEHERKMIKDILKHVVDDGLIYNNQREYQSYFDIIKPKYPNKSPYKFNQKCDFFNNIIDSKSKICI